MDVVESIRADQDGTFVLIALIAAVALAIYIAHLITQFVKAIKLRPKNYAPKHSAKFQRADLDFGRISSVDIESKAITASMIQPGPYDWKEQGL